jgi:hypothetical protein
MKIIIITMAISSMFILNSCSSSSIVAPSQNSALNSVSSSGRETKTGFMQNSLNSWLKDEWTPTVTKDKEIQEKYMKRSEDSNTSAKSAKSDKSEYVEDKGRDFTLQEYVDKASVYQKSHPADYENSNVRKLESMPVIGK